MALYITSYRRRELVVENATFIGWKENPLVQTNSYDRWEGWVSEIHEGGQPFGSAIAVLHLSRTDVDTEEDIPHFNGLPTDENVESESWTEPYEGRKLYRVQGELWRNEWIEAAKTSPRIRHDKVPPTVFFITDAQGTREDKQTLQGGGRWLWFQPNSEHHPPTPRRPKSFKESSYFRLRMLYIPRQEGFAMKTIKAEETEKTLQELLQETAASHEPIQIISDTSNGILVSEEDWRAIQETLYLLSIPGMRESIREGMATPLEDCSTELNW